jgi:hypothetical protein
MITMIFIRMEEFGSGQTECFEEKKNNYRDVQKILNKKYPGTVKLLSSIHPTKLKPHLIFFLKMHFTDYNDQERNIFIAFHYLMSPKF